MRKQGSCVENRNRTAAPAGFTAGRGDKNRKDLVVMNRNRKHTAQEVTAPI